MNDVLFSVVVVTYNQEKYISQTIDSILNQKHDYSYEIIIGEDCSSDGTKKIIEEYAAKYPLIVKPIYNSPNKGFINNYFNVVNQCTGKYIMECAGDDYWLPGKVKTQIEYMEKHPNVGVCYGKAILCKSDGKKIRKNIGKSCDSFDDLLISNQIPAVTVCFRNELLKEYIKNIDPLHKDWLMEDYPMWLWFSKKSKISFLDKKLCAYRLLQESACRSENVDKQLFFYENVYKIKSFFANMYKVEIPLFNRDKELEGIYLSKLKKEFSLENVLKYKTIMYKNNKGLKRFIKNVIVSCSIFVKIYFFLVN